MNPRLATALSWAAEHLPDEDRALAAASFLTVSGLAGRTPTPDEVRGRLKEQGRDRATLAAAGEGER
jgi:hypothetical protein